MGDAHAVGPLDFGVTTPTSTREDVSACASVLHLTVCLQIPGASVTDVVIEDRDDRSHAAPHRSAGGMPVRQTRYVRSMTGGADAGAIWIWARRRLWLVYEIRRVNCPDCGVRTEELPWARPGARHTRDFEDMVLWLAQRTDRTSVATLMRCAWETVTAIINRGVAELLDATTTRAPCTASASMRSATATRTDI